MIQTTQSSRICT